MGDCRNWSWLVCSFASSVLRLRTGLLLVAAVVRAIGVLLASGVVGAAGAALGASGEVTGEVTGEGGVSLLHRRFSIRWPGSSGGWVRRDGGVVGDVGDGGVAVDGRVEGAMVVIEIRWCSIFSCKE